MKIRFVDLVRKGLLNTLDWIYPPVCAGCGEPGCRLCLKCQSKFHVVKGNCCTICGEPLRMAIAVCQTCLSNPPPYAALRSLGFYEGVIRDCIHALKYENNQGLGEFFAEPLAMIVKKENWQVELVVPVPLSSQRIAQRGYNQSAILAKPLASRLKAAYSPFALNRTRDTRTQVGLSAEDRRLNVTGAFEAVPALVSGKIMLLVDDVLTTGSTLEAAALALKDAGAESVYCLTIARFSARISASNFVHHPV